MCCIHFSFIFASSFSFSFFYFGDNTSQYFHPDISFQLLRAGTAPSHSFNKSQYTVLMASFTTRSLLGCLLLFASPSSSAPAPLSHVSGGAEHIVILDKSQPIAPKVAEVLARLDLHEKHADVRYIFNNSAFIGFVCHIKGRILWRCTNVSNTLANLGRFDEVTLLRPTGKYDRGVYRRASSGDDRKQY